MKDLIIFGVKDLAQLARFYFEHDFGRKVAAFTVDREYKERDSLDEIPIVAFDEVEKIFSPDQYEMFLPITQKSMGKLRETKFRQAKDKGYTLATYISPRANYYGTPIGENCFIFEGNTIQPFTTIGTM